MPVAKEYVGVSFRQVADELRWSKDGDKRTNRTRSQRPIDERTQDYTDSDEHPTLVKFDADDNVNVDWLLAQGMIVPHGRGRAAASARDDDDHPPSRAPLARQESD